MYGRPTPNSGRTHDAKKSHETALALDPNFQISADAVKRLKKNWSDPKNNPGLSAEFYIKDSDCRLRKNAYELALSTKPITGKIHVDSGSPTAKPWSNSASANAAVRNRTGSWTESA